MTPELFVDHTEVVNLSPRIPLLYLLMVTITVHLDLLDFLFAEYPRLPTCPTASVPSALRVQQSFQIRYLDRVHLRYWLFILQYNHVILRLYTHLEVLEI